MWSLPDIIKLNEEAVKQADHLKYCAENLIDPETEEKATCKYFEDNNCEGELTPVLWKDIFSDDYKGLFFLCERHYGYYGYPNEEYFYCSDCGEVYITNYTWENYYTITKDGKQLCLNCTLNREIGNPENWVTSPNQITWEKIRTAKHLIAVEGKHWEKYLKFLGNVEFDSWTGEKLYSTREEGIRELQEIAKKGIEKYGKVILILDSAYQFAVSIGIYAYK